MMRFTVCYDSPDSVEREYTTISAESIEEALDDFYMTSDVATAVEIYST